jgi:hypothetical protein
MFCDLTNWQVGPEGICLFLCFLGWDLSPLEYIATDGDPVSEIRCPDDAFRDVDVTDGREKWLVLSSRNRYLEFDGLKKPRETISRTTSRHRFRFSKTVIRCVGVCVCACVCVCVCVCVRVRVGVPGCVQRRRSTRAPVVGIPIAGVAPINRRVCGRLRTAAKWVQIRRCSTRVFKCSPSSFY